MVQANYAAKWEACEQGDVMEFFHWTEKIVGCIFDNETEKKLTNMKRIMTIIKFWIWFITTTNY